MSAFGVITQLGAINISALDFPQTVVQIEQPQPLFNGVSTNIAGMVGSASWGPLNAPQAFGNPAQGSTIFGTTANRLYDLMGHATVFFLQGPSFLYGVRVSDGTDVAASSVITADIASFGTLTEVSANNFVAGDTVHVGNVTFTFVSSLGSTAGNVLLGASFASSAANLVAAINGGAGSGSVYVATATSPNTSAILAGSVITVTADIPGVGGNSLALVYTAAGTAAVTASAATLSGGAGTSPVFATATFTETSTNNFIAGDTVKAGNNTFTFVSTLGTAAGNVLLGSTFALSAANLVSAINATSGSGTTYLVPPNASNVSAAVVSTTIVLTALTIGTVGNALASVYTAAGTSTGSFGAATFAGGVNGTAGLTLTGKYTGVTGNLLQAVTQAGSKRGTFKVIVALPGQQPEIYDNIGGTGNAFWVNAAAAINSGNSTVRGPSQITTATAGTGVGLPSSTATVYTFSGGTDGASGVTTSMMLGQDVFPRTGMYSLRGLNCAKAMLNDVSDTTSFSTQVAFGLSEGCEMVGTTAAGDTIQNAVNELAVAGIDTFTMTVMFGNWIYWNDTINNVNLRLLSPQSAKMGVLCNLSPQNSALNKQVNGIVGTQRSVSGAQPYTSADLQLLGTALMDVIDSPSPGGNYFSCLFGKNASSNIVTQSDTYTQVTYYLAKSLLKIGGAFIGQTMTPTEMTQANAAITNFLAFISIPAAQGGPGIIGTLDGSQPFKVVLDTTNNSQATAALGYQFAYIQCTYLSIVTYFIFTLQGGTSVTISNAPPVGASVAVPT